MAGNSKDRQLIEMKDTIRELNITISDLRALVADLQKREEEHLALEKNQQEQIDYFTKKMFGKKSENRNDDIEGQLNLFNEAEVEAEKAKAEPSEGELVTVKEYTRKKKPTMEEKFAGLPVKKVYLDVPEDQRICPECGTPLERIGETFVRREIEIIKPSELWLP